MNYRNFVSLFYFLSVIFSSSAQFVPFVPVSDFDNSRYSSSHSLDFQTTTLTSSIFRQWVGIDGAPSEERLSLVHPFSGKMSGAFSLEHFSVGNFENYRVQADYAYKIRLTRKTFLYTGFNAVFANNKIDFSRTVSQGSDPVLLSRDKATYRNFDAGASIVFKYNDIRIGLSVPEAIASDIKLHSSSRLSRSRQYIFQASYLRHLDKKYSLETVLSTFSTLKKGENLINISAALAYNNFFRLGLCYAHGSSAGVFTSIAINSKMRIAYRYQFGLSKMNSVSLGSHFLGLEMAFGKEKSNGTQTVYYPEYEEFIPKKKSDDTENLINRSEIDQLREENEHIRSQSNKILKQHQDRINELEQKILDIEKNKSEQSKNGSKNAGEQWDAPFELLHVKFGSGSDKIYSSSFSELNKVVNKLVLNPQSNIRIVTVNCENFSVGFNQYLAERRAEALRDYFVNRGIKPGRISVQGRVGESGEETGENPVRIEIQMSKNL